MADPRAGDFVTRALAADSPLPTCTLPELLDQTVRAKGRDTAIHFLGRDTTYDALATQVARAARGLQTLGVGPGDRVGLCLPNTPYFPIFYFATLKLGAVVVNFNPLYVERELEGQIRDSGTTVMVTIDLAAIHAKVAAVAQRSGLKRIVVCSFAAALPPLKDLAFRSLKAGDIARVAEDALNIPYARLVADRSPPSLPRLNPTDIAVIQYTGGTTGTPKGATLTHANLTANCAQVLRHLGSVGEAERILAVLPLFHVFALTSVLNYGVAIGAEMILLPRFDLADTLKTIRRRRPTNFPAVPTIYNAINTAPAKLRQDLGSIRHCVSGGAPLPLEVKAAFERLTGCTVVEGYGLSETSPVLCVNPLDSRAKAGSVGPPVAGTTIEIRDPEDPAKRMAQGERGEVCARGPQVMGGYWNKPEETRAAFVDGAFRTGDVGYVDPDGFVFLVDRLKDLILCGGYNVYPRTIEEALYRHPAVREATVIGVPDEYRGEAPKAFVALKDGESVTAEALKAFLAGELSKIELPREIEIRDALPRTPIGKLSKKELEAEETARREAAV